MIKINKCCKIGQITKFRLAHKWRSKFFLSARRDPEFFCVFRSDRRTERARSIQPKFQPVRPGKEDHLKRWTRFSKLFRLDRTDPLSFGPKFPESLVEWIAPRKYRPSYELPYEIPAPVPDGKYFDNLTHAQSSIHLEVEHGCRVMNESREIISDTFSNFISMCGTQICSITGEAIRTSRRLRKNS